MKLTTAVISLVTIGGAYGKGSKASTKSSKSSKSTKAICIEDSSLSFSLSSSLSVSSKSGKSSKSGSASKSGKASSLSYSSKSGKAETDCEPCIFGDRFNAPCGTDVGFCEFENSLADDATVCTGEKCTPQCRDLEPICVPCFFGPLLAIDCPNPTDQSEACEIVFSVESVPTCASSDCALPGPPKSDYLCGTCTQFAVCPQDANKTCEVETSTEACTECTDTDCPNTQDRCFADGRRLGMSHEEWDFKKLGLGIGF